MESAQPSSTLAPGALPTAPTSPDQESEARDVQAPFTVSFKQAENGLKFTAPGQDVPCKYPTPPASRRASSMSPHSGSDEDIDGVSRPLVVDVFQASRPSFVRLQSGNTVVKLRTSGQTQTAIASPIPNITTSSVPAAHISNPTSSASSAGPSTPTKDAPATSALSSLTSHLEMAKLTDGMDGPAVKATPPITPRTLSNDGTEPAKKTPPPTERSVGGFASDGTSTPRSGAPVPPPKGELIVTIAGARGLRPSFDPYAVCVFEWIESIAHHHKQGESGSENGPSKGDISAGAVPMSRNGSGMGSGMGRSMAIPMKSRQSSTASLSDQKEFKNSKEVTDPQWDHEAVLCV